MQCTRSLSVAELEAFLRAVEAFSFTAKSREEKYAWLTEQLIKLGYRKQTRKGKKIIREFLLKMTGYKPRQLKRLISYQRKHGRLTAKQAVRHVFPKTFTARDVELLAKTDNAHLTLSGPATKAIMQREYEQFGKKEYVRLAHISVSHIYNLRQRPRYREQALCLSKTRPTQIPIGERRKPNPEGKPGYLRVDSVHQGDGPGGEKGVYHINLIDEVTQWECVVCVETICDRHLLPALTAILDTFPFVILSFHSDNGSEYINKRVAEMLNNLAAKQTKNRPRRHNDNALAEGKNGSVIRKQMGYHYIPGHQAEPINRWYEQWLNPYLNYHHPCAFPRIKINAKGKEQKTYPQGNYATPYEKLKSLPKAEQYLKLSASFAELDQIAYAESDTEWAEAMMQAKRSLFRAISPVNQPRLLAELPQSVGPK